MSESTDAIDAAIHSAESLFASLLDRVPSATGHAPYTDPESSLIPMQSLEGAEPRSPEASIVTLGTASLGPAQLTAHSHAVYDDIDPRESLSALVSRASLLNLPESPSYDTLYKTLKEKENDLDLAAKIGRLLLKRNDLLENDLGSLLDHRQQLEQQVAQLKHTISQKEELLRLYARDATERDEAEAEGVTEGEESKPEWVVTLTEECRELRESNLVLKMEADQLRKETADIETKERELVQQCLEQFSEAKRTLSELRERSEESYTENQTLQTRLEELSVFYDQEVARRQQLTEDDYLLKEQLAMAHDSVSQLTNEVSELNEKFLENSVMLKEAKDEITALKEISMQQSSSPSENGEEQHESIVREIEEALRKEIVAASMLPERPRSPNHYARQRTMVVMETVRAATLATARRLERLASEADKVKSQENTGNLFNPLAVSSPSDPRTHLTMEATPTRPHPRATPPSPIQSDDSSPMSLPDDLVRYRNQTYVAPQKLQIVKPLEGSVTLLKWKLLASPQLGGAKAYFSDASRPGVHLKKWPESGVVDERVPENNLSLNADYVKQKSVSAMDLRELNTTYPPSRPSGSRRGRGTRGKEIPLAKPDVSQPSPLATSSVQRSLGSRDKGHKPDTHSTSLLSQFGSFLGSSLSKLRSKGETVEEAVPHPPPIQTDQSDAGLGGLL